MSNLGLLIYYLGIEVHQNNNGITINQSAYAQKLLKIGGLAECNVSYILMEPRLKLTKNTDRPAVDATLYRSLVAAYGTWCIHS